MSYQNQNYNDKTPTTTKMDPIHHDRHDHLHPVVAVVQQPSWKRRGLPVLRLGLITALVVVVIVGMVFYDAKTDKASAFSSSGRPQEKMMMIRSPLWGSSHKHQHKHHHKQHETLTSASSSASKDDDDVEDDDDDDDDTVTATGTTTPAIPMPHGVNLGSWLSLEDYFYVGDNGAVEVATPDQNTAAVCLPPLHVGQVGAPDWQSETDLLKNMLQRTTAAKAIKVFHAHRMTFITQHDLESIAQMGIKHVRVPLSWCFTDYDPDVEITSLEEDDDDNTTRAELLEKFTCLDPYYQDEDVRWPAIPRILLERFLRACAKLGITASLDLHTYPGATSPGTFSGVWPKQPRFWNYDDPAGTNTSNSSSNNETTIDFGRQLYRDFIAWMEQLDDEVLKGVLGISPMNEPAHLAGVFAHVPTRNYLPPLPSNLAKSYLHDLNHHSTYKMPDGPHLRVLLWIADAVEVFRTSKLARHGKQLHVNLHESVLAESIVKQTYTDDDDDDVAMHAIADKETKSSFASIKLLAAWWNKTTTPTERQDWAILDIHHYHAWSKECSGATDGPPSGNYSCGDVVGRNAALERCAEWAPQIYRAAVDEMCGKGAKLMSGEFSTSTHHRVRHACNDIDTLRTSFLTQMKAAQKANVKMYYWSFKMPFGGAFRSAWSFTELMYLLGVTDRPDEDSMGCGEQFLHDEQVTDDFFEEEE
eukprot:scaffold5783_cov129-Amphora_coffeaeformis.AAC.4